MLPTECPPIADLKACEAWLARASLADPRRACRELTVLLESLEETPPRDSDYLDILERLREPVAVAQHEHTKRFATRPLPLKDDEQASFHQVAALWITLGRAYRRLLESLIDSRPAHLRPDLKGKEALLAQRALDCAVDLMLAHYRCRREVDGELWRECHQLYRIAEGLGVAKETVPAGRKLKAVSSPVEVYNRALLLSLAHPYALTPRELGWLRRWSAMWGFKVELQLHPEGSEAYAVDTAGDAGPEWRSVADAAPAVRFLYMPALRRSVGGRIKKLEAGEDPQALGLGKDCVQPECGRLLVTLLRNWIERPAPRQFGRRQTLERTELVSGLATIHVAIGGKLLKSQSRHWDYSRRDADQLFIYQGVGGQQQTAAPAPSFDTERWETLDESATGFRLRRKGAGERLYHQQLVALKAAGANAFMLCDVRWLVVAPDESLTIGAHALPGMAEAAAVRPIASAQGQAEPYTHGFLLPAMVNHPDSVILPVGWFQPGREIEIRLDEQLPVKVRLETQLRRGYDFDQASFKVIG